MGKSKVKGTRELREREREKNSFIYGITYSQIFTGSLWPCATLSNPRFPRLDWRALSLCHADSLCMCPLSCCWTPSPNYLQGMDQWFPGEGETGASWWSCPNSYAFHVWPPFCFFLIAINMRRQTQAKSARIQFWLWISSLQKIQRRNMHNYTACRKKKNMPISHQHRDFSIM